jgi:hypothetical protein
LRAVVAMALAATEVKKKEKARVSRSPTSITSSEVPRVLKNTAAPSALRTTPSSITFAGRSRSVRSWSWASPWRKARTAMPKEPTTTRRDLTMPKIPAVAMAPTPMRRT